MAKLSIDSFKALSDIGKVKVPGKIQYDATAGTYTFSASGSNMWFSTDAFSLLWMKVKGDFQITGEIAFQGQGANPHRKLGFMVRESLDDNSAYADIAVHGDGLTALQYRLERGGETFHTGVEEGKAPTAIYLARKGNVITSRSGKETLPDEDDGSITIDLPEECYVGLFMCSHEEDIVETGCFCNVNFK